MKWLFRDPSLSADESVKWKKKASLGPSTGSPDVRTAVAGVLYVTTIGRLLFVPNRGNLWKYTQTREWQVSDIAEIGEQKRDWTGYTGGMQKRLRIGLRDGRELLFVVSKRDEAVNGLRSVVHGAP
jgi:hypothetical protein